MITNFPGLSVFIFLFLFSVYLFITYVSFCIDISLIKCLELEIQALMQTSEFESCFTLPRDHIIRH